MTVVHKRALHDSVMLLCEDLTLWIYNLYPASLKGRGEEQKIKMTTVTGGRKSLFFTARSSSRGSFSSLYA